MTARSKPLRPKPLRPKPLARVMALPSYQGAGGLPPADEARLAYNESPLPPPPAVVEAHTRAIGVSRLYVDAYAEGLREALAQRYGLDADRLVCAPGSSLLLRFIAWTFLSEGMKAVCLRHAFATHRFAIVVSGATPVIAEEPNCRLDVDTIIQASVGARVVFVANPSNPTGATLDAPALAALHAGLAADTLLVVDEAYADFAEGDARWASALAMAREAANIVVTRTFSKAWSMAGLRVGWAYGSAEAADALRRVMGAYALSWPAQEAARAALADRSHVARLRAHVVKDREWLRAHLMRLGLAVLPSAANFVLARLDSAAEAERVRAGLGSSGVRVRAMDGYGFPDSLRITIGSRAENRRLVGALEHLLRGQGGA